MELTTDIITEMVAQTLAKRVEDLEKKVELLLKERIQKMDDWK